jgi:pyruvate,water dikinase
MRVGMDNYFKKAWRKLDLAAIGSNRKVARAATFRLMYERFREILALNDSALELIADIEDLLGTKRPFSLGAITSRIRKAAMDIFVMVKNINLIAPGRHEELYGTLQRINDLVEAETLPVKKASYGKFVVSLDEVREDDAFLVGSKMANLGAIKAKCRFAVPEGFVITTEAFLYFMIHEQLWERCERLDASLSINDSEGLIEGCREVQAAVLSTPVPAELANLMQQAFEKHFPLRETLVAMRSSAVGEDTATASHAGLYCTELNTDSGHLLDAYRKVLASALSPAAVSYRFQCGITLSDSLMAVGCIKMVQSRCSGIAFSRPPDNPDADVAMISLTPGTAEGLAAGIDNGETLAVRAGSIPLPRNGCLNQSELADIYEAARQLEFYFQTPQDIEWAIDQNGSLIILQSRPITAPPPKIDATKEVKADQPPILEGGFTAFPGIASGSIVMINPDDSLAHFPAGGILVARHSSPDYAQIMGRCAAIVTDVGSPTGHMSSLAREFRVPTIVGLADATRHLQDGQNVTVDAWNCRIFNGSIPFAVQQPDSSPRADPPPPAVERLRRIARLVTPLTMTDPASHQFHPHSCQSLHDITRYVHEKAFEVMFHFGDAAGAGDSNPMRLEVKLPIIVELFDVGGGIQSPGIRIKPEQILSTPMRAFLEGLLEPNIRWNLPRPVSMRGFFSVLGESMAGPPPQSGEIGRVSYAIISDCYMNFSTKAGYHFSTVDTYCGQSVNRNYIHFRFLGGAADQERRQRRVRFVSATVGAMDFQVQVRGDTLVARLDKYESGDIQSRLASLGRLTLCARQLDMLMDSDSSPDFFARAFLAGEWDKF